MSTYIIIGMGAAGVAAAETLRKQEPESAITVFNGEPHPFYLRLDLEDIFRGKTAAELTPRTSEYWHEQNIHVRNERAVALEPASHVLRTSSGAILQYDRLLIAVGAAPRDLPVPGRDLSGIVHYRTLEDALAISEMRDIVKCAVIAGGGILGLELAKATRSFGWHVILLVRGGFVGSPLVSERGSRPILRSLVKSGVDVRFHEEIAAFRGERGRLTAIQTLSGEHLECECAGICIGVMPSVEFLNGSELLDAEGRLVVNNRMQTIHPDVFAAGDCAYVRSDDGRLIGCTTWSTASAQARIAAANLSGGSVDWSEGTAYNLDHLFDLEFAAVGPWESRHLAGRVLHETDSEHAYAALVEHDGVLESAFLLGDRSADRRLRKLIAARSRLKERIFAALDASVPLDELMQK